MTTPTPSIGDIVYLTSLVLQVGVEAQTTMPDTPNQYSAKLGVMGDEGAVDLSPLRGKTGNPGVVDFTLRKQATDPNGDPVVEVSQLPPLTNTPEDIGKYYLIPEYDVTGHVIQQWAYIWYGTNYRRIMMGAFGPPGPVPAVQPQTQLAAPGTTSYVTTDGETLEPTWQFNLASPIGPPGAISPLNNFSDFSNVIAPQSGDVVGFTGSYNLAGQPVFAPVSFEQIQPQPYSVPESAFNSFDGFSEQAPIGSFMIPAQTFAYTPIVWGHIGGIAGIELSSNPFMLGVQVLLGNQTTGVQVARGLGNTSGLVNIMPHYSNANNTSQAVTPTNSYAVVQPGVEGPASTLYFNLWNDGAIGAFLFSPTNAQLFVSLLPLNPSLPPITSPAAAFAATGTFAVSVAKTGGL